MVCGQYINESTERLREAGLDLPVLISDDCFMNWFVKCLNALLIL